MGVQTLPENIPAQINDETLDVVPADSELAIPYDHEKQWVNTSPSLGFLPKHANWWHEDEAGRVTSWAKKVTSRLLLPLEPWQAAIPDIRLTDHHHLAWKESIKLKTFACLVLKDEYIM
jgi:hypothetical protein